MDTHNLLRLPVASSVVSCSVRSSRQFLLLNTLYSCVSHLTVTDRNSSAHNVRYVQMNFGVLLTVQHLSIILVINQLDAQNLFYNKFITCLYSFLYFAHRASQYIYLNINQLDALNLIMSLFSASTCFEHKCSSSGGQNCTIQCDDTRDCIIQF